MSKLPKPATSAGLTELEQEAMEKSGELAYLIRKIIGDGPNAYNDWAEAAIHIHALQNMLLSQVAARAYPETFRLLGQALGPKPKDNK
jgi:hypothetical protein